MREYSFLIEALNNTNNSLGIPTNPNNQAKHISVIGVLKPLSIGSISKLIQCKPIELTNKINYQLNRVNTLITDLQFKISNPKYEKVKQNNEFELRVVRSAYAIHRAYFTKLLYFKSRGIIKNPAKLEMLQSGYKRQLFLLSQNYKKSKLTSSMEINRLKANDDTQIPQD